MRTPFIVVSLLTAGIFALPAAAVEIRKPC